jgi:hypothetical protein
MIAMHPHQPVYSSREAAWQGCAYASTSAASDFPSFRVIGGQKCLGGLLDCATIVLSNANPGGTLP